MEDRDASGRRSRRRRGSRDAELDLRGEPRAARPSALVTADIVRLAVPASRPSAGRVCARRPSQRASGDDHVASVAGTDAFESSWSRGVTTRRLAEKLSSTVAASPRRPRRPTRRAHQASRPDAALAVAAADWADRAHVGRALGRPWPCTATSRIAAVHQLVTVVGRHRVGLRPGPRRAARDAAASAERSRRRASGLESHAPRTTYVACRRVGQRRASELRHDARPGRAVP